MFIFRQSSWTVIVWVVLICFKESVAGDCKGKCLSDWVYNNGSCYSIIIHLVSWEKAVEVCKTNGAKLAEIDSMEEDGYVKRLANDLSNSKSCRRDYILFWLGATDKRQKGTWVWVTSNEKILYSNWLGYHYNEERGNCLAYYRPFDFNWFQSSCTNTGYSICEQKTECSTAKY